MKIKEYRKSAGLTQKQFSDLFKIPIDTVKNWDSGRRNPPEWAEKLIIEKLKLMKENVVAMTDLEIMMMDGCTKSEAEKHLKNGSVLFEGEEFEKNFDSYMDEWGIDEDERAEYKAMIDDKNPVDDWGIVEHEGKTWYIMYVL